MTFVSSKNASTARSPYNRTSASAAWAFSHNFSISTGGVSGSARRMRLRSSATRFTASFTDSSVWAGPRSQVNPAICLRPSPTSESPARSAWSRKVSGSSFESVANQSDIFARSTAIGFRSRP